MNRWFAVSLLALSIAQATCHAAEISGQYIEARTCDVWTGPCFANAEMNLSGKHAVLGWKVDRGSLDAVRLDGLSVVAVIAASDTLGLEQTGPAKAVLIVDKKANSEQREALIRLARQQGGELVNHVVAVESAAIELSTCSCREGGCAFLKAGDAKIETRCLENRHDKVCGNESAFYPPLAQSVQAMPAVAVEHSFCGKDFNETWKETDRRGAYVGTFTVR
jgi:hypothetical protein